MRYDAVVFDNDGVLTTPTERGALRRAIEDAFAEVGVADATAEDVETLLAPTVEGLEGVADARGVDPTALWDARERAAIDVQAEAIRAGRKTLYEDVAALEGLSVPRAIVSNNQHETIGTIVDHFGLEDFSPWYGREPTIEGIERKKPRPHYVERAIGDLGAKNPLYVGDSRVDIEAAAACGIDSAFIRRSHREGYALSRAPTHEIDSLEAIPSLLSR
ncbi:HAD family hydrolase [Saliphagus sp. LR7]|uniref:HAD family hydrolase n=1 Tax=Saliphagus sp. LR7 TaxID=2282654 RepID=UPI000DF83791|nr:HAD family hydrolase [Saliphagus sp. LR7]